MTDERPQSRRVDIGDLAFRLWDADPLSTRPAFVLVHGIGVSHRYLARLHRALRRQASGRFGVVSVDLPGYAGLPKPDGDADVTRIAEGLAAALAASVSGPVVLVGHSMGAQWVTELVVRRPVLAPHVTGVVLMGPVADEKHRGFVAQARALAADTLRESMRTNAIVFSDYIRCGVPWYLTQLRHMLAYPLEERVSLVEPPVLVLRGERDRIAGDQWCRRLAAANPRAALAAVPGGAHVVQNAVPERVAATLLDFAASTRPPA